MTTVISPRAGVCSLRDIFIGRPDVIQVDGTTIGVQTHRFICHVDVDVASRKRVLETIGDVIAGADDTLSAKAVFEQLWKRESLGSTGLGHGVGLPHARMPEYDHTIATFVRLSDGVDFSAHDGERVDLFFGLLVPSDSRFQRKFGRPLPGVASLHWDSSW